LTTLSGRELLRLDHWPLVDETAVVAAPDSGHLAGAGMFRGPDGSSIGTVQQLARWRRDMRVASTVNQHVADNQEAIPVPDKFSAGGGAHAWERIAVKPVKFVVSIALVLTIIPSAAAAVVQPKSDAQSFLQFRAGVFRTNYGNIEISRNGDAGYFGHVRIIKIDFRMGDFILNDRTVRRCDFPAMIDTPDQLSVANRLDENAAADCTVGSLMRVSDTAASAADTCDRLAASPYDATRATGIEGVRFERVDASAAIDACKAALRDKPDDARLAFQLARALEKDGGFEALAEAVRLYRLAAEQGHAAAQYNLGAFYENGHAGLPRDDEEAARLYRLAADQGLALAQARLGLFYMAGRGGLPKDDQETVRLSKLAADQGVGIAQESLGLLYESGRGGLPKDDKESARLYKLAADQGVASAQGSLGRFYETGRGGLPRDDQEAARLYRLAADQGNTNAQGNLARLYAAGRGGLPRDEQEAARLFKLVAGHGDAIGQYYLGFFYENGRGGLPKNDRDAARLYRLAADQGIANAQTRLGFFYQTGRGALRRNMEEAARLYTLAANQGDETAKAALEKLHR
jgi:TPR repeat protein